MAEAVIDEADVRASPARPSNGWFALDFRGWITASLLLSAAGASKVRADDGSGQTLGLTNDSLGRRIEGGLPGLPGHPPLAR